MFVPQNWFGKCEKLCAYNKARWEGLDFPFLVHCPHYTLYIQQYSFPLQGFDMLHLCQIRIDRFNIDTSATVFEVSWFYTTGINFSRFT